MKERRYAKAGDELSAKAAARFRSLNLLRPNATKADVTVKPKAPGDRGQWICIDCGEPFMNNMQASGHAKSHRLAWRNFETCDLEEA